MIDAGNHVGRLDEGERERGLEIESRWILGQFLELSLRSAPLEQLLDDQVIVLVIQVDLDVLEEAAESLLLREDIEVDILAFGEEGVGVHLVVFQGSLEVFFGLLVVAENPVDDASDQPQLTRVLLGDRLDDVVEFGEGVLVVLAKNQAQDGVVRVLVNVEGAQTHIRQVSLATGIASVLLMIILPIHVARSSRRLVPLVINVRADLVVRELILWVQHFVLVHDAGALLKVREGLVVLAAVDVED